MSEGGARGAMTRLLSAAQIAAYRAAGYVHPIAALTPGDAARFLARMDALEGPEMWARTKNKPYLAMTWLGELARQPAILDAVEDVLGPDLLLWGIGVFDKKPHDPRFLTWHQDSTYWGLSVPDVVTAWVALTPSTPANGCMRVIPGSHLRAQLPHREAPSAHNILSRGQEVAVAVDEAEAVDLVLHPGEMSLHHTMTIHGSNANASAVRRVGIAIRYVAAHVRQTGGVRDSATLVRGVDRYGHFQPEPVPARDFDPDALAFYRAIKAEIDARKERIARGG